MNEIDFCPNKDCEKHQKGTSNKPKWYNRYGFYYSKRLKKRIQRFKCKKCGKTFSEQTFHVDYWIKITINYDEIEVMNRTIRTISEMAKLKNVSYSVIRNRIERLSRQYIAIDYMNDKLLG